MPNTAEEIAALKAATREAHEALKDLKRGIEEAKEAHRLLHACIKDELDAGIEAKVKEGLEAYQGSLLKAIDSGTESVYARFDRLADIMLGEDKQSLRTGKPTIPELVERKAAIERAKAYDESPQR